MLDFLAIVIREAGAIAKQHFGTAGVAYTKAHENDVVTAADLAVSDYLIKRINDQYPEHAVITEEACDRPAGDITWIIDPVDGTFNFATRVPIWGVIIGIMEHGELRYGAMYDPVHDDLVIAAAGGACQWNGQPVRCSSRQKWAGSVGLFPSYFIPGDELSIIRERLTRKMLDTAQATGWWKNELGSAAISAMLVATGRRDWYVSIGGYDWDYAGAVVVLRAAGCVVTNLVGEPWQLGDRAIVAANPEMHRQLLALLNN